jgi:hypothetical protein
MMNACWETEDGRFPEMSDSPRGLSRNVGTPLPTNLSRNVGYLYLSSLSDFSETVCR